MKTEYSSTLYFLRWVICILIALHLMLLTSFGQSPIDSLINSNFITPKKSLVRRPDLVYASFKGAHLSTRTYRALPGRLGVRLEGDNFITELYEVDIPARQSITGQLNIFGVTSNDVISKPNSKFWQNLFFNYAIKATWNLVPPDAAKNSGVQHHVELGVDFGARYFATKHIYVEAGVMLQPLAMSYLNLIRIPVPNVAFPQMGIIVDEVEVGSFHMYASALPFIRAGFYPFKRVSIDFTLGYHAAVRYFNTATVSPIVNGSRNGDETLGADLNNLFLDGKPLQKNNFNFNGRMWGIGFTVHIL